MEGMPGMGGMGGMGGGMQPQMAAPVGPPVMGMPPSGYGAPIGPPMGGPAPGMQVMTLTASVPGGQTMQYQSPTGPMNVQVPMGVQPGQQFQFQVAGPPQAQGAPPVVMATPLY